MSTRRLVSRDGSSDKFWDIELDGKAHTVTFGRVGTAGQDRTKEFDDETAARKSFEKLVAQKLKKGYVDADDASAGDKSTAGGKAANQKAAKKKPSKKVAKKSTKMKGASAAESNQAAEVDLSVTNAIDLDPLDRFAASFVKRPPLKWAEPGETDLKAAQAKLETLKTETYGWRLKYETLDLAPMLPREEAHFWFLAMTGNPGRLQNQAAVKRYAKKIADSGSIDGKLSLAKARKAIGDVEREIAEPLMAVLMSLFKFDELLEIVLTPPVSKSGYRYESSAQVTSLCQSFRQHVVPYLSESDLPPLRDRVRKTFNPALLPSDSYHSFPAEHYLAAMLGMHEQVYEAVSFWEDGRYANEEAWAWHYQEPQSILCGLGSAEAVEEQWRRVKAPIVTPDHARQFLACTQTAALDVLADQICRQTNKDDAAKVMKVLCLARAPEAAEPILKCRLESKAPAIARNWLDTHVGNAVVGLIETAGGKGKLADAAVEYLRSVKRAGHGDFIAKCVKEAKGQAEAAARVQKEVVDHVEKVYTPLTDKTTPKWLADELAVVELVKKTKLPTWAAASQLPPLIVHDAKGNEHRLNDEQIETVLRLLAETPVAERDPLLQAIKQNIDKTSRDAFAWKLFEAWQEDGSVAKNKWAMGAIGHLGDDQCVLKLTPMVRAWPGESQHARAVFGLECLRAVGTNTALMQLSGIAQKLKFKGLKAKAAAFVEDIAKERGMSRAELEDRVIPDCGLDENGRREFSFGARSFSFVLGGDLKPMVRDEAGKVRANMPKPGVKDDEKVASASLAEWKLIKKQIKEVATLQAGRLEQAMVTGRRWSHEDFETLLVRHPLMTHLVQKLIWGAYDAKGNLTTLFRVTEERDYANVKDDAIELDPQHTIGLMHPLEMDESQRAAWGEVLSDYEIVAPFPQLGREVYSLEKGDAKKKQLPGFDGLKLAAPTMVFTLEKFGWVRGQAMDAGGFDEHSKQFPSADVTAVVHYDGVVGMGYIDPNEMLKIESIHFCPGMREPSGYGWGDKKTLKLSDVSPIVLSEVMADLNVLKSKAK